MADFIIKEGDDLPVLRVEFKNADGTAIDLTGATISFEYRLRKSGSTKVSRTCVIEDAEAGIAQYSWENDDTTSIGVYIGEFIIEFSSGKQMSFPSDSYLIFEVIDDLA